MSILEKTYHETGKGMSVDILEGGRTATFHWTIQRSGKHGSSVRSLLPQDGRGCWSLLRLMIGISRWFNNTTVVLGQIANRM